MPWGKGSWPGALTTRSRYDAAGRLVEQQPIEGGWNITQYVYDDLGRLIQTLDNQQHGQRIEYDDVHQRIIQTEANGLQTIRLYDGSGLLPICHAHGLQSYLRHFHLSLRCSGADDCPNWSRWSRRPIPFMTPRDESRLKWMPRPNHRNLYDDEGFISADPPVPTTI